MAHLLLFVPNRDVNFVNALKHTLYGVFDAVSVEGSTPAGIGELTLRAKMRKATHVATTSFGVFKLVDPTLEGTAADNYGALTKIPALRKDSADLPIILLPPLANQFSNGGTFMLRWFLEKLRGLRGIRTDKFSWDFVEPYNLEAVLRTAQESFLCAVDIETSRDNLLITSCAYTFALKSQDGTVRTKSYVVRCNHDTVPFCITAIRRINDTAVPKVMQRGQYDSAYFVRFNAPLRNYIFDTYNLMHCLYPEWAKDLAFMAMLFLKDARYWKEESSSNLYEYNAKDTHSTLWVFMAMLKYCGLPRNNYALSNYVDVFPNVFPMLSCGLDGLEVDEETRKSLRAKEMERKRKAEKSARTMLGIPNFNPNSSKQVITVVQGLAGPSIKDTSKISMQKFSELSPVFARVRDAIKEYRGAAKAISTYFDVDLFEGNRLMYELDPSGTDTGRTASKASQFWCGTQVQNIPPYARAMVIAPEGWSYCAVDKAQAESYCTAYLSQDTNLLDAVNNSPDFHCHNASMFFGIPFEELYDVSTGKKLRKDIRDIAKRVNHGANYNMGADVLLDTMGTKAVLDAQRLLGLPREWSLKAVCTYLLNRFDETYPKVRGEWYQSMVAEVRNTSKLVTPDGWTRYTFLRPEKSKLDLNAMASSKPQGLSARLVNQALKYIWRELQLKKYKGKFRLKAQIHDEIMFMATDDIIEQAAEEVAKIMEIPITIHGRTMVIPSTFEIGKCWKDLK